VADDGVLLMLDPPPIGIDALLFLAPLPLLVLGLPNNTNILSTLLFNVLISLR